MSTLAPPAGAVAAAPPGERSGAGAREVWRSVRVPVLVGAFVVVAALVVALVSAGGSARLLDPSSAGRPGSRAAAEILRAQGIDVRVARDNATAVRAAGPRTTVLIALPDRLGADQSRRLAATGADLVLVSPARDALDRLAPGVRVADFGPGDRRAPGCDLAVAVRAGSAEVSSTLYRGGSGSVTTCYRGEGGAGLVQVAVAGHLVTVVGDSAPFTNDRLDVAGNAALALGLLGEHPRLVWYLPSLADVPSSGRRPLSDLVPRGIPFGLAEIAIGVLLLAAWRVRRLGPVVTEPLPAVVPAAEAVRGRARLYRRGRARDTAARVLREASVERLAVALALPRPVAPAVLVDAAARRSGRSTTDVGPLLYGPPPARDDALVQLATRLLELENEVRRP